jgi:anti-sigma factor RsiW
VSRVRCGGPELPEYAVGRLPVDRTRAWDRHLVTCRACLSEVTHERQLQARLASMPAPSSDLRTQLLALAARELGPQSLPSTRPSGQRPQPGPGPRVPEPPRRGVPLVVMAPSDPPAHRSVLRAVVLASTVAGLGVTAAWSLSVAGSPTGATPASTVPAVATVRTPSAPVTVVSVQGRLSRPSAPSTAPSSGTAESTP